MTDLEKMVVRRNIYDVLCLTAQLKAVYEYAPIKYCSGATTLVQIHKNESFEKVREAFDIKEEDVQKSWFASGNLNKTIIIDGRAIEIVLDPYDEGYEMPPKKENEANA